MRGTPELITTMGLLGIALLLTSAAAPPEAPASPLDRRMPMAIAQPLGAIKGTAAIRTAPIDERTAMLSEPGMLVLVGSALLGLAAVVRKTT